MLASQSGSPDSTLLTEVGKAEQAKAASYVLAWLKVVACCSLSEMKRFANESKQRQQEQSTKGNRRNREGGKKRAKEAKGGLTKGWTGARLSGFTRFGLAKSVYSNAPGQPKR